MSWKHISVLPTETILSAIKAMDDGGLQVCLVVNNDDILLGIVTDGDVRRAILKKIDLASSVSSIMNSNPIVAYHHDPKENILEMMRREKLRHIPIVDQHKKIIHLEILDNYARNRQRENLVVIMAGGLGKRLLPLTEALPKPLLAVGEKPVLESVIEHLRDHGFCNIMLAVNYKSEMITRYFDDGKKWQVNIRYLQEDEQLGTGGALSLVTEKPKHPLLVMNADLITKINLSYFLDYHNEHKADITLGVREFSQTIPYGVVRMDQHHFISLDEKPSFKYFVNAGIYVLEPHILKLIPKNTFYDMPQLLQVAKQQQYNIIGFPVREYWLDIGRHEDYQRACEEAKTLV